MERFKIKLSDGSFQRDWQGVLVYESRKDAVRGQYGVAGSKIVKA